MRGKIDDVMQMGVSKHLSDKVRWISFVAILCVILGHCGMVSPFVVQWHVPWFFVVSGAFLHRSVAKYSLRGILFNKLRALVLPYLVWCAVGWFFVGVVGGKQVSLLEWFGFTTIFPAGNPHLWYLHCLIVFVFASTLIWKILSPLQEMVRNVVFPVVYIAVFGTLTIIGGGLLTGTPTSPFYFLLGFVMSGALLCDYGANRKAVVWSGLFASAVCCMAARCIWCAVAPCGMFEQMLRAVCVISQIAATWFALDFVFLIMEKKVISSETPWFVTSVFFVYCSHGFVLKLMRRVSIADNSWFTTFVLVTAITFGIAGFMRKYAPRTYKILSGGR